MCPETGVIVLYFGPPQVHSLSTRHMVMRSGRCMVMAVHGYAGIPTDGADLCPLGRRGAAEHAAGLVRTAIKR
jgi:hypothetical protein